jgi:hypothetical protein
MISNTIQYFNYIINLETLVTDFATLRFQGLCGGATDFSVGEENVLVDLCLDFRQKNEEFFKFYLTNLFFSD